MLLSVDGLDKKWNKGVKSPFEGELGWHERGDVEAYAPLIFRRVKNGIRENARELDCSQMGTNPNNLNFTPHFELDDTTNSSEIVPVRSILSLTNRKFRNCLVVSFHRRWMKKNIVWPSRTGEMEP